MNDIAPAEADTLAGICGLLIGAGRPLAADEIAEACRLAKEEVAGIWASVQGRLASVGICLLRDERERWFVALEASSKARVARLSGDPAGRKQISAEAAETLALIQEKGPLTLKDIERLRGANPRNALDTLRALGVIQRVARAQGRGGAWLYASTGSPNDRR